MVDDNENGGADEGENSADLDAQIKALQAKKQATSAREAQRRNALNEDDSAFLESKPKEPGKFDGEVREPGWRWDRSQNDWFEHRGVDLTKRANAGQLPYNFRHTGDGSPDKPHRIEQEQRWM